MRGRLLLIAGLITGFVLGSRAGRRAYEQLRSRVQEVTRTPAVQSTVGKARDLAQQRAPRLTGVVSAVSETAAHVGESVHQAGEQALVPVADTAVAPAVPTAPGGAPAPEAPAAPEPPSAPPRPEGPAGADLPVGVEATGTDAALGAELVGGGPGIGPVGAEVTTSTSTSTNEEDDHVER